MEQLGLVDRIVLVVGVDDDDGGGQLKHALDAAEQVVQTLDLLLLGDGLLLAQGLEVGGLGLLLEVVQQLDALVDGLKVGQGATQPAVVDVEGVGSDSLGGDDLLGDGLGADKQDLATLLGDLLQLQVGGLHHRSGLVQIDDVSIGLLGEDVGRHGGVPPAGLVSEVGTDSQKLLSGDDGLVIRVDDGLHDVGLRGLRSGGSRFLDLLFLGHLTYLFR